MVFFIVGFVSAVLGIGTMFTKINVQFIVSYFFHWPCCPPCSLTCSTSSPLSPSSPTWLDLLLPSSCTHGPTCWPWSPPKLKNENKNYFQKHCYRHLWGHTYKLVWRGCLLVHQLHLEGPCTIWPLVQLDLSWFRPDWRSWFQQSLALELGDVQCSWVKRNNKTNNYWTNYCSRYSYFHALCDAFPAAAPACPWLGSTSCIDMTWKRNKISRNLSQKNCPKHCWNITWLFMCWRPPVMDLGTACWGLVAVGNPDMCNTPPGWAQSVWCHGWIIAGVPSRGPG